MSGLAEQWARELEAVLDPGKVYKHGVLVAARREIESLRAKVEEWKAIAFLNAESVQRHLANSQELAGLARYHAMHAGVSKGDRARIAELCDRVNGEDAGLDSSVIMAACESPE